MEERININQENFQEENFEYETDNNINETIEELEDKTEDTIENEETIENTKDKQEKQTISETMDTSESSESEISEEEIDIETIRKMLGEVRRIPERVKTERKYYEEDDEEDDEYEKESLDFTLISEALYNVYAQGLKWATYVIVSRITPGLETKVIRELHLPKSAQKQIVNALNKVLQKRFAQWAVKLSEEGTLVALLMLYSTTYITQAVMLAYQLKASQNYQNQNNKNIYNGYNQTQTPNGNIPTQNENIPTEKPKRRRGRPPKKQKTETTETTES
jgi:hypothetical protein